MKCTSQQCLSRTTCMKDQLLNKARFSSATLIFMPAIAAYCDEKKVAETLREWRQNGRCVFIDGSGEQFVPPGTPQCFFVPPAPSSNSSSVSSWASSASSLEISDLPNAAASSSGSSSCDEQDEERPLHFFRVSDPATFANLFRGSGPLHHLSFLRHLFSLEDVKSSCKAPPNSENFFQCHEGDALVFDRSTLLHVRQLNPIIEQQTQPSYWPLALSLSPTSDSLAFAAPPCPCGCALPAAVIVHTFNVPSKFLTDLPYSRVASFFLAFNIFS